MKKLVAALAALGVLCPFLAWASTLIGNPTVVAVPASWPAVSGLYVGAERLVLLGCGGGSHSLTPTANLVTNPVAVPLGNWCSLRLEGVLVEGTYTLPGGQGQLSLELGDRVLGLPPVSGSLVKVVVDVAPLTEGSPAPLCAGCSLDTEDPEGPAAAEELVVQAVVLP